MIFWQLQLRQLQVTDAKQEVHFADYFSLRLVCTVLALVTVVLVAAGLGYRGRLLALTLLVAAVRRWNRQPTCCMAACNGLSEWIWSRGALFAAA